MTHRLSLHELRAVLHASNARLRHSVEIAAQIAARPSRPPAKAQSARSRRPRRRSLVLVVEDDRATGRVYRDALEGLGCEVMVIPTLAEARDMIDATGRVPPAPRALDVAIIDLLLPDGNGAALVPLIRARSPEARILISTGVERATAEADLRAEGVDPASVEIHSKITGVELRAAVGAR